MNKHLTSAALAAAVVLAAGSASTRVAASEDPVPPDLEPTPCYLMQVVNRCVPACYGRVPTVAVPGPGVDFYAPAGPQVIVGTNGDDRIHAHDDDDVICGLAGIDVIWGGAGNDDIYGGEHADQIYGEENADDIVGEGGDDIIDAGTGADGVWGGSGADGIGCGNDNAFDTADGGAGPAVDFLLPNTVCEFVSRVP